jgi:hypothetical protein
MTINREFAPHDTEHSVRVEALQFALQYHREHPELRAVDEHSPTPRRVLKDQISSQDVIETAQRFYKYLANVSDDATIIANVSDDGRIIPEPQSMQDIEQ